MDNQINVVTILAERVQKLEQEVDFLKKNEEKRSARERRQELGAAAILH